MGGKRNQISVKLDDRLFEHLARFAKNEERALGWLVRKMIEEGLERRGLLSARSSDGGKKKS